jgi:spore coat protein U-like protein
VFPARPTKPKAARRAGLARAAAIAAMLLGVPAANAATATATLTVSARVGGFCYFSGIFTTNFNLTFGAYAPAGGNRDVSATLGVRCASGVPFQIALNGGGSGSVANRRMSATGLPAEKLDYQLYTNAARTVVWGDGSGGSSVAVGTGGGLFAVRSFTVYGRVPDSPANQAAAPRTDYRDVVTITVTY